MGVDDLAPPVNITSEQACLGSILVAENSLELAEQVFSVAAVEDFYDHRHLDLAVILTDIAGTERIDAAVLLAELRKRGKLDRVGGPYLHTLVQWGQTVADPTFHAREVHAKARARALIAAGTQAIQAAHSPVVDLDVATLDLMTAAERLHLDSQAVTVTPPQDVHDFLAVEHREDWVIRGLIERNDRVMITGKSGLGKSVLCSQFAVCAASGIHPFTFTRIPAVRTLVVDVENGRTMLHKRYRRLVDVASRFGGLERGRLSLEDHPEGLNLLAVEDQQWLSSKVAAARPDLLVIGPAYKLYEGNINDESVARGFVAVLDRIRVANRCAVILEAHAGHGGGFKGGIDEIRPRGSSLFINWTPFGFGLRVLTEGDPTRVELAEWRGPRDERDWPERLHRSVEGFPWVEDMPSWSAA